jgi:ribose 1,5-bisphosphokinase
MDISTRQKPIAQETGRLFYIMGASGAGKDTLLQGCQDRAVSEGGPIVARRYITRQPDGGTENHLWLSPAEFEQRVTRGDFAMHWAANGHCYGIGREIDQWLADGQIVMVNGSRSYLNEAAARYGNTLTPLLIRVDPARLKERLVMRGRESMTEIEARLQRANQLEQQLPTGCLVIENNGPVADAVSNLLEAISGRTIIQTPKTTEMT